MLMKEILFRQKESLSAEIITTYCDFQEIINLLQNKKEVDLYDELPVQEYHQNTFELKKISNRGIAEIKVKYLLHSLN